MAVETAADRAAFLDSDEFGTVATLAGSQTVDVLFDDGHVPIDLGDGVTVSSTDPRATLTQADFDAQVLDQGDVLTIAGTDYEIADVQPDGRGMVVLVLRAEG